MTSTSQSIPQLSPEFLALLHEVEEGRVRGSTALTPEEVYWRDHQVWLEQSGYMLRPRYHPNWVSSAPGGKDVAFLYEDSVRIRRAHILDATRISTGEMVMLKRISQSVHPHEVEIAKIFAAEPLASHPRNHCSPLYEVLIPPGEADNVILVTPFLRAFDDPPFDSIGEIVEFFRQVFEGLQFMHQCHVAHRDCMGLNIMMDPKPIYPNMFHPRMTFRDREYKGRAKRYSRTAKPVKYYLIDFGISCTFNPAEGPPSAFPIQGGDKTAPEILASNGGALDPFPTDIYYMGNMIKTSFLEVTRGIEFMAPLVEDMIQVDPTKRPTIDTVVQRYREICHSLSWWTLRSRLKQNEEAEVPGQTTLLNIKHFFQTVGHILQFRSSVPTS